MKKYTFLVIGVLLTLGFGAIGDSPDSCDKSGRIGPVCRAMKHMRSHIVVLETQRDLVAVNFPYLESALSSMRQTIVQLMTGMSSHVHLEKLENAKQLSEQALQEARRNSVNAFRTANMIKTTCQQCHNAGSPPGLKFEEIFGPGWGQISGRCNEVGHNPIVCKNMYALVSYFDVFMTGANLGRIDFGFAQENAKEIQRIARLLQSFSDPIHEGGNQPLQEVEQRAAELQALSQKESMEVLLKAPQVSRSCLQCHNVGL